MNKLISVFLIIISLTSCSEYQKAIKSEDLAVKNKVANELYEKGKYTKALRLFEQIAPAYRGKPNAERLFYMFSKSYYNSKQYYLAGYQFESFVSNYPRSEKREEGAFLAAECFVKYLIDTLNRVHKISEKVEIRKISIKDDNVARKRKTKLKEIEYDAQKHHIFKGQLFKVAGFLI